MKKEIRLFVADVDGTLRTRNNPIPPKETLNAFEEMHKQGYLLGIASGRPLWQGLKDHYKEWKLSFQFDFLIGMNGGEIWTKENNQTRIYNPLTKEQLKSIVLALHHEKGVNPFVYRDNMELSRYIDDEMILSSQRHGNALKAVSDESELWEQETGKILYRCDTEQTATRIEQIGKMLFAPDIACFKTSPKLVELQNSIVSKGSGLMTYCHSHNISLEHVIAFGDAENDIEMLKCAGWSVALKDGMRQVKDISDDITEVDAGDGGVGVYLWNHLLHH